MHGEKDLVTSISGHGKYFDGEETSWKLLQSEPNQVENKQSKHKPLRSRISALFLVNYRYINNKDWTGDNPPTYATTDKEVNHDLNDLSLLCLAWAHMTTAPEQTPHLNFSHLLNKMFKWK